MADSGTSAAIPGADVPACSLCAGLAIKPDPPKDEEPTDTGNRGAASDKDKESSKGKLLDVFFTNGTDEEKNTVKKHAPIWSEYCSLKFNFHDTMPVNGAQIRIWLAPAPRLQNQRHPDFILFLEKTARCT